VQLVMHPAHLTDEVLQRHPRSIKKHLRTRRLPQTTSSATDCTSSPELLAPETAADAEPDAEAGTTALGVTAGTPPDTLGPGSDV
jgi:hypothetical protein